SEWFATLNAIENSQWFIIFDSGRAKEKKNRGHVMEKIKSDFARFLDRLIEMNEQNEKISLEFVQLTLSTALDNFIASHENYFLKLKTSFMSDGTWNLGRLINQQVHICRIYWSLSLFENVLALLDELGLIITDILNKVSEKSSGNSFFISTG
uniref:Spindle pole body component n=1 Tax=Acrobeloides nanus TaxID=290746 RepID=A0A914D6H6_9BILA